MLGGEIKKPRRVEDEAVGGAAGRTALAESRPGATLPSASATIRDEPGPERRKLLGPAPISRRLLIAELRAAVAPR